MVQIINSMLSKGVKYNLEDQETTNHSWMLDANSTSETSEFVIICPRDVH